MIDVWRKHLVLNESMLDTEYTCLTPEAVLKTLGHDDRCTDLMVKDPILGECFRADKALEDAIGNLLKNKTDMSTAEQEKHLSHTRDHLL